MSPPPNPPRRLRVLHWITHLGLGGAESVALSLIRGLRDTCNSAVYAVEGMNDSAIGRALHDELRAAQIPFVLGPTLPAKFGGMVVAGLRGGRFVREFQPDVVHLHTEIPEAAYSALLALQLGTPALPVVRTIHNSRYWHHWPRLGRWCDRRLQRAWLVAVSNDARTEFDTLRARSGACAPPAPATVIYNGVPAPNIPPAPPKISAPAESGRTLRLLFAGRFEAQKGTDLLPDILAAVRLPSATSCDLVLHGSGKHEGLLRHLVTQPPPGWSLRVLPPLAHLSAELANFDLVIMPSRYEGLGLVAIESALAGTTIVATDAPGLREALPPTHPWRAQAGDAASFAAILQTALAETHRWPAAAAEARAFAQERFDFTKMCAAYLQLYQQAASQG